MKSRGWLVIAACAGCGRIGFGPLPPTGDASAIDSISPTVDVPPTGNNVVFATHNDYTGALGGLAGADTICAQEAGAAGLSGHYVAWLSTSTVDAGSRLVLPGTATPARGWVRRDGKPVFDMLADLAVGHVYYPIRLDAAGNDLEGQTHEVMTGTTPMGTADTTTCADWTAGDSGNSFSAGDLARTTNDWTDYRDETCDTGASFYCFGVDTANPLPPLPAPAGRIAFLSETTFDTTMTIANADTACTTEATAHGLPGTYLAFVATSTATAASRFDPVPGPWYRIDGIQLAATGTKSLAFNPLDVPIVVAADSDYNVTEVWTGATDPGATAQGVGDDCADWSTNLATGTGYIGKSTSTTSGFHDGGTDTCDTVLPVYCFQQ